MHKPDPDRVTAIILAGGKGRRLGGIDKGLIEHHSQPLVSFLIERLLPQTADIIISANRNRKSYAALGYPVIADTNNHFNGPLAGLSAAMRTLEDGWLICVPCDAPLIPNDYIARLCAAITRPNQFAAVAHDGRRIQPTHALLHQNLLHDLNEYLENGERSVQRWLTRHEPGIADFGDCANCFVNANTPAELARLKQLLN